MVDLDNIFKLATLKYVYIRDWKLGVLKYSFTCIIFVYVIVYEILYACVHLTKYSASGHGVMNLEQPTRDCDPFDNSCISSFRSVADLFYCDQFLPTKESNATAISKRLLKGSIPKIGDRTTTPRTCRYFDGIRSVWHPPESSEIFVPLRYTQVQQTIEERCYDPLIKGYKGQQGGRSKYHCHKPWRTVQTNEFYIADMENFILTLAHSLSAPALDMFGTSADFQGFVAACPNNHPKDVATECKRAKIPNTSGDAAPEDLKNLSSVEDLGVPSLAGTKDGADGISVIDLLKVTPIAQQYKLTDHILDAELPAAFGHPGKSIREAGGMLLLDVDYDNTGNWRPGFPGMPSSYSVKPVTYTYRPYFFPIRENVRYQVIETKVDPQNRTVDKWYGLTIKFQFNGKLVKFIPRKFLKTLTSGLVLLSCATSIVAVLAAYVLPLREKYSLLMYQLSEDFSDYKVLRGQQPSEDASMYATSQKLLDEIANGGKLSPEAILSMFCINEMRLNRLDAMDPKLVLQDDDDVLDSRSYCIGNFERDFYQPRVLDGFHRMSARITGSRMGVTGYQPVSTNDDA